MSLSVSVISLKFLNLFIKLAHTHFANHFISQSKSHSSILRAILENAADHKLNIPF
jgi:hypothetical protein